MGIIDFILRRSNAYRLRKEYDRLRERADKIRDIEKRLEVLRMLDQIEPSIISMEEHHMSNYEKKRIRSYVSPNLRKVRFMIDETKRSKKEERNDLKDEKQKY